MRPKYPSKYKPVALLPHYREIVREALRDCWAGTDSAVTSDMLRKRVDKFCEGQKMMPPTNHQIVLALKDLDLGQKLMWSWVIKPWTRSVKAHIKEVQNAEEQIDDSKE